MTSTTAPDHDELDRRAERLKERVYVSFAALAVVMTMRGHVDGAGGAAKTLVITVGGTLLAVLVADLVSHVVVHQELPHRAELRHFLGIMRSGIGPAVIPLILLAGAGTGAWQVDTALQASTIALLGTLIVIGWAAARRLRLSFPQRLVVLGAEGLLGLAVVLLELAAHH
ncbi:hypothetical protein [Cellulomonas sp. NPDC089187]|uniref:hypothetical protein n=1 Tax=Cellulomonas sp. NPDC089187 TaxID=3154970 RepID=UPI003432CC53